jgi:hypothetical protein
MKPGGPPTETETALFDVSVAGTDISDLLLVTANASTLRGRFVFEQSDVRPPAASAVRAVAQAMTPTQPGGASSTAKDNFTFEMKSLAGRVMIRASIANEWRLRRVTVKGVDITDAGIEIPPNSTIDGIVIEMTTHLGQLLARPIDDTGTQTRDCVVVAFARDAVRWTPLTRFVIGGSPSPADGIFGPHLPAGDYLVAAFTDESPSGLWNDPDILNQLRERAVAVSIADDEKKPIDVKIGPAPIY